MKKLVFILAIGVVCISSCKKDYTCTCTTTTTVGGVGFSTTTKNIIPGATQQQATTICIANEVYAQGGTQTTRCSL